MSKSFFASFFSKKEAFLLTFLVLMAIAGPLCAQDVAPPPPPADEVPPPADTEEAPAPEPPKENKQQMSPPDAWVADGGATLRVMNKIDSTVHVVDVPAGGTVTFESLTIKLTTCYVRPPDLPADAAAHLTITDSRPGQPGFDGWILKNEPALHMLEHPVYDVQLAGCG